MSQRVLRISLVVLLAGGIGLAWWTRARVSPAAVVAWVESLGVWGPLVFVGVYSLAPALFFPGAVLTLAGGALFGPLLGALLSLVGTTVGATVAFLLARSVAADWVEQRLGRRLQAIKAGVEREGWRFVALVRLVPVLPFNFLANLLRRDNWASVRYDEGLNSSKSSVTLQSTDRHDIVGQKSAGCQLSLGARDAECAPHCPQDGLLQE